jgi:L-2-hydroxycarboxylate dehydrogenase (NAD+)
VILTVSQLSELYRAFIRALGGTEEEAAVFADRFIVADLRGMEWQGLKSLDLHVVDPLQQGYMSLGKPVQVERETAAALLIEANGELGQLACSHTMNLAIRKAREAGTASFAIRHCGDTGLLASYTLPALEEDCVAVMFNNANPYFASWGGTERMHGIDPLSIAVPAGEELPILLDMSLTPGRQNFDVEEAWKRPFTPPPVMFFETLREYLLTVTLEAISGALTGMPLGQAKVKRGESAVIGLVMHVPSVTDLTAFKAHVDGFIRQVKSAPAAESAGEILMPGERGFREHERRSQEGIPVEDRVWAGTVELGAGIGIDCEAVVGRT